MTVNLHMTFIYIIHLCLIIWDCYLLPSAFYNRSVERDRKTGLLIIQCEAANNCVELLDSVRYIIQRETNKAKMRENAPANHTVLLLSLSRGLPFNGFQGNLMCIVKGPVNLK